MTLPSNAGDVGLIPGGGAKIPHALGLKNQNMNNRSKIVTNSIKTLQMVHIKKKNKLKISLKTVTKWFLKASSTSWAPITLSEYKGFQETSCKGDYAILK